MSNINVLITGSLGFVGTDLLQQCRSTPSIKVMGIDKSESYSLEQRDFDLLRCNLTELTKHKRYADIKDFSGIVVHLAAARTDDADAEEYFNNNIVATIEFLKVLKPRNVMKFIHVSSVAAIDGEKLSESDVISRGDSDDLYRYTKYKQQVIVEQWCAANKVKLIVIAPSAIYDSSARTDTNIGRLTRYVRLLPIMPCIDTRKSLTRLKALTDMIMQQIVLENTNYSTEKYMLIDLPVLTVSQIVKVQSSKKIIFVRVPFLQSIMFATAGLLERLGLHKRLPLTKFRVKKLFRDTSYGGQKMFKPYPHFAEED